MKQKLLLILFLALLIRLISLNQSLWLDEATTARVVKEYRVLEIISRFSPGDFHPPLYYLLMKFWTNLFGYSEVTLRLPSVIFSLLTGWIVYHISRLQFSDNNRSHSEALRATIFFLFNPLIVYYSQEARMYMMTTFFLTGALFYFFTISSLKSQVFFGFFISLAFLTFYGSIFLIVAFLIFFFSMAQQ